MPPKTSAKGKEDEAKPVVASLPKAIDVDAVINSAYEESQRSLLTNPSTTLSVSVLERFLRSYNFSMEVENEITSNIDKVPPVQEAVDERPTPSATCDPSTRKSMQAFTEGSLMADAGTIPEGYDYTAVDHRALGITISTSASLEDAATLLCSDYAIPSWRQSKAACGHKAARTLFRWIAANVVFDPKGATDAEGAFSTRKADSQGMAKLYEVMCQKSNLIDSCTVVPGLTRKGVDPFGSPEGVMNWHWNLVVFEEKKYLCDVAMSNQGAGFENFYWGTNPTQFLNIHLPNKDVHQLQSPALSKSAWEVRPVASHAFFSHGLEFLSHRNRMMVVVKAPPLYLTFRSTKGPEVDMTIVVRPGACNAQEPLFNNPSTLPKGFIWQTREESTRTMTFTLTFPTVGLYTTDLFVQKCEQGTKMWSLATRYQFQIGSVLSPDPLFPFQVLPLSVAKVHEPRMGKIICNRDQAFVVVPTTSNISAVCVVNRVYAAGHGRNTSSEVASLDPAISHSNQSPNDCLAHNSKPVTPANFTKTATSPVPQGTGSPVPSITAKNGAPDIVSATCHLLSFDAQSACFLGKVKPQLGLCDVYVRHKNKWELLIEGYKVVKSISQKELSMNDGKPLMASADLTKDTPYVHRLLCHATQETISVISQIATVRKVGSYFDSVM